jgi:hypothetical protein
MDVPGTDASVAVVGWTPSPLATVTPPMGTSRAGGPETTSAGDTVPPGTGGRARAEPRACLPEDLGVACHLRLELDLGDVPAVEKASQGEGGVSA